MTTKWIAKSVLALAVTGACAIPACESGQSENIAVSTHAATTTLVPGDVAITCYNSNSGNPLVDFLQLTPLVPIDNDTDIKLTDREATAAGIFNPPDENADIVVPLRAADAGIAVIPAGTPIPTFTPGTGLGNGAEQVFIYTGSISATGDAGTLTGTFLWGFQNSPAGGWAATRDDGNNVSERLIALLGHDTAVSSTGNQNMWFYDTTKGPSSGTKAVLQAAIQNPANWTSVQVANVNQNLCPTGLTVLADAIDGGVDAPSGAGGAVDAGAGGTAGAAGAGAGGTAGTAGAGAGGTAGTAGAGAGGTAGTAGAGAGGTAGTAGAGAGGTAGTAGAGAGGTAGTAGAGAGGTAGTVGGGSGGSAGAGAGGTAGAGAGGAAGSGAGGASDAGSDARADAGAGGAAGAGAGGAAGSGAGGASDAGSDARADAGAGGAAGSGAGGARADAGAGGARADAGTDAKVDASSDAKPAGGSSGCSCSTATSTSAGLGTSAWMLALAGIVFTARRRRRR